MSLSDAFSRAHALTLRVTKLQRAPIFDTDPSFYFGNIARNVARNYRPLFGKRAPKTGLERAVEIEPMADTDSEIKKFRVMLHG